jgi:hypothetical protein
MLGKRRECLGENGRMLGKRGECRGKTKNAREKTNIEKGWKRSTLLGKRVERLQEEDNTGEKEGKGERVRMPGKRVECREKGRMLGKRGEC